MCVFCLSWQYFFYWYVLKAEIYLYFITQLSSQLFSALQNFITFFTLLFWSSSHNFAVLLQSHHSLTAVFALAAAGSFFPPKNYSAPNGRLTKFSSELVKVVEHLAMLKKRIFDIHQEGRTTAINEC